MKVKVFECKSAEDVGLEMQVIISTWLEENPVEIIHALQSLSTGVEAVLVVTIFYR